MRNSWIRVKNVSYVCRVKQKLVSLCLIKKVKRAVNAKIRIDLIIWLCSDPKETKGDTNQQKSAYFAWKSNKKWQIRHKNNPTKYKMLNDAKQMQTIHQFTNRLVKLRGSIDIHIGVYQSIDRYSNLLKERNEDEQWMKLKEREKERAKERDRKREKTQRFWIQICIYRNGIFVKCVSRLFQMCFVILVFT